MHNTNSFATHQQNQRKIQIEKEVDDYNTAVSIQIETAMTISQKIKLNNYNTQCSSVIVLLREILNKRNQIMKMKK